MKKRFLSIFTLLLFREGLTRKKKSVKFHTWVGGQDKIGSFSHFFLFFFLSCPKSCKAAKKFFFNMGGRVPLCLKVKIFWTFNVLKKKILKFHTFFGRGWGPDQKCESSHFFFSSETFPNINMSKIQNLNLD